MSNDTKKIAPELQSRHRLAIGFSAALGGLALARGFVSNEAFDFEERFRLLGIEDPELDGLSHDSKRFRLQRAYLSYCQKKGWRGKKSETFIRTGKAPESDRTRTNTSGRGANDRHHDDEPKRPTGLRKQMVAWVAELNEMGLLDMSISDIKRAYSNAVGIDIEAMAARIEMVATTLREIAKDKPVFSDEALEGQKRLEQEVLSD